MLLSKLLQPKILLSLICILFICTRLYKITEIPVSVYWDEASIGYNAYSVAQTGKDEWGKAFPIHFRAFGEFKLPVYIYTTATFVYFFGLNEFSVRFPAVLFSLGVVILTYFLAKKLSGNSTIGLFAGFFISISPWFFIFSRTGYEVTAGLMFYLLAVYLFLIYNKNIWYIFLSIVSFILSAYSYNSFRIIIPLTILVLIIYHVKDLKNILKKGVLPLLFSGVILIISIIPVYRLYVYDSGISRFQVVSTNRAAFITNYLSHFSLDFLILSGDQNLRSQQQSFGQIYSPQLILLLLGLFYMIRSKSKEGLLLLVLFILGPIPAAITKESPHALRSLFMIPFISIISAEGVVVLWQLIKKKSLINLMIVAIFLAFFVNYFTKFLDVYPVQSSKEWQYGYKKIFTDYQHSFEDYNQVIISDEYAQPYIFALFYQKINPNEFRQTVIRNNVDQWGFSTVSSFGKFKFGKVNKISNPNLGSSLIFASNEDKILNIAFAEIIKFLDGNPALWIYKQ